MIEKNGENPVQYFEEWDEKLDSQVVVFAVKKKHKNFGYHFMDIKVYPDNDLTFKESLAQALKYKQDFFIYRGRSFNYYQEENSIKILYNNNHIANAFIDNDELIIESKPSNKKTINALSPSQAPVIKNSVLVNMEDFIDVENSEDELESNIFAGSESAVANA